MKAKCIFCEKETKDEDLISFGDELSCTKCHTEIFNEVDGKGKEKEIILPDDVNSESELYDFIDEDYEWFEKQLSDQPTAWKVIKFGDGKATIKYI